VPPIARILARKAWNPPNPSRHQIELNVVDWSHWTDLEARGGHEEGVELLLGAGRVLELSLTITHAWRREAAAASGLGDVPRRVSPWVRTLSTPRVILLQKPHVTVPQRAREWSSGESPMAPLRQACALPPSAGCDVPLVGPGLDRRYHFVLIKS
jgi:hypothetical protein